MVHDRLTTYLEDSRLMPDTMFGYRQLLSAQDTLLQLKEGLLVYLERHKKVSIITIDVQGAFSNLKHEVFLQNLQGTKCGIRTYQYGHDFLKGRTATVGIGNIRSDMVRNAQQRNSTRVSHFTFGV
ncbi:uncharacterized protein LOC142574856 [Dermacentor variabilis]|uniref:uncharacterized protein LOC142574856 n=1 Tax=Dermacentor variabilis TaxID=34621 RepID=UPI003F5C5BD7